MRSGDFPVLVTGAGGFIGGRLVEVLAQAPGYEVRASVRRWSSAARIGRLPVEIVLCDVTDRDQVRSAMKGVRGVIHCATGDQTAKVVGIRNVLECAVEFGIERVVHFSTIEVYGDANGEVSESTSFGRTGRNYGDAKIEAEEVCWEFIARGCPVTILRPSLVYGPFSDNWTVEIADRLVGGGRFPAESDADGICNLVYVDDVVAATMLALQQEGAVGEAFNVNGPDQITWSDYLHAFRETLGVSQAPHGGKISTRIRAWTLKPVRAIAKAALRRFEGPIMALNKRSPLARRAMKSMASVIQNTPTSGEFRLLKRKAYFPTAKAQDLLGFRSAFPMSRGMALTGLWLQHHGFGGNPRPVEKTPAMENDSGPRSDA